MNLSDRIARLERNSSPPNGREHIVFMEVGAQTSEEIEAVALAACHAQGFRAATTENTWVWARSIVSPSEHGPIKEDRPMTVTKVQQGSR